MSDIIKNIVACGVGVVIIAGGIFAYWQWELHEPLPEGLIQANGRIEGDHVPVASKFAGRVKAIHVREADSVKRGQTLAELEDDQLHAKAAGAHQAVVAANAKIKAEQLALELLKKDAALTSETAKTGVAFAQATLDKAKAAEEQAHKDAERVRKLAKQGALDGSRSEHADLSWTITQKDVVAADTAVKRAQQQQQQAELGQDRIGVKQQELLALQAQLDQAKAAFTEADSALKDLTIKAPASGVVMTRTAEVGQVIAAGPPLLQIVDLDHLYLKVYVAEDQIGQVRLGLPAQIYTDAFPDRPFPATVRYVSPRAEFTPKEVQTPDERTKLVYAVKLYLDENPDHCLTPGLPADAVIRWKEEASWSKPRW